MKRLFLLVLLGLSLMGYAQQTRQLTILHTSDTHSRIDPIPSSAADSAAGLGGIVRRATFLKQYRAVHPDLLLFDSGDFSQGTPYYTFFQGEVEVRLMNYMGYTAITIGNHEYDFGLENMARIFRMAEFPVVCANCDFTGTPLEGVVKPYTVVERQGIRIGIFGLSPRLAGLVPTDKYGDVRYLDPIATTREVVKTLREQERCEVVICLSHLGFDVDMKLAQQVRNVDLYVGGHSHTFLKDMKYATDLDQRHIPIVQSGCFGITVGEIKVNCRRRTGQQTI